MNINNFDSRETVGLKFHLFRKAIKVSARKMAEEAGVNQSEIANIESGHTYPKIKFIHFLNRKYALNINWLIANDENMFIDQPPVEVDSRYVSQSGIDPNDPRYEQHLELIRLLQVPEVETWMLDRLQEIKDMVKDEDLT